MARRFDLDVNMDLAGEGYSFEGRFDSLFDFGLSFGTAFNPNIALPTIFSDNYAAFATSDITASLNDKEDSPVEAPQLPSQPIQNGPFGATFELSSLLAANGGDGSTGFIINGINVGDGNAISVSSAGDINGDGFDDIIIGASQADPNGNYSGQSYVVFGQSGSFGDSLELSALNGTNGFVINGANAGDFSGTSVSSAGDINGDGFDDILIGAFNSAGAPGGESYVIFGQAGGFGVSIELSTLNGTNGFVLNGIDSGDRSGASLSSAGDVNGDGFDDILIGARDGDPNGFGSGESYIVFGQAGSFGASFELSTLNGTNGFVINGVNVSDRSGWSVSFAGDMNGDGFGDILIGADRADPNLNGSGASYVVFGQASGFGASIELSALNGTNGFVINGIDPQDYSGFVVSSAGDINGDGFDDILIGANVNDPYSAYSDESYVVFGQAGGFAPSFELSTLDGNNGFVISGVNASDYSALAMSSAGDVNGDGFDDILIGATAQSNEGVSYLVFGQAGGFSASLDPSTHNGTNGIIINGIDANDGNGGSVSSAGDINGDGFDDILIGARGADPNGSGSGESYVIYGRADFGRTIEILSVADDVYTTSNIGEVVYGLAGDDVINGGVASDVLFGGEGDDTLNGNAGNDRLEGGEGNDTLDGGVGDDVAVYNGNVSDYDIVNNGDGTYTVTDNVNGNGIDTLSNVEEVLIGTDLVDLSNILAASFELSSLLAVNGGDGSLGTVFNGIDVDDFSGGAISSAGDINSDGFDDILIGARSANPNGNNSGESYIVFGQASGFGDSLELSSLNGTNGFVINGIEANDRSGTSVSSAGDVNGDGFDDFLIGAPGAIPNNLYSIKSYVVFGQAGGFGASLDLSTINGTNGFVINGMETYDASGITVSAAGDVNGDGFDDILIGAIAGNTNGSLSGDSYVVFGQASGFGTSIDVSALDGTNGFTLNGIDQFDFSGSSISSAGDVNGDGFDDILIGSSSAGPGQNARGESYVVFGQAGAFAANLELSSLNGTNGFVINGVDASDSAGHVSSAGDINGDGFDDILIGASGADPNGSQSGESYIVFGQTSSFGASLDLSSLNGINGFVINGIDAEDRSGGAVSSAGDVNGDGLDDILIGANGADPNGSDSGESYIIFGQVSGFGASFDLSSLNGSNGFIINGIDDYDGSSGSRVSSAGDINGDGFDDILIGASGADPNGNRSGESYVIYGRADFGRTTEILTASNDAYTASDNGEVVYGLAGDDLINGGTVSDVLSGDEGDDTLNGAAGNDRLEGGAGNDTLNGGDGDDTAIYEGVLSDYYIVNNGDGTYSVTDNVNGNGSDTLTNIEFVQIGTELLDLSTILFTVAGTAGNDNLMGSTGDDVINGLGGNDILDGLAGDDTINGGDGADRLIGGLGADALNGGAGFDSADYRGATSGVRFNVETGGAVGEAAGDTFSGLERYYLSNFNDIITGSSANEFFFGEDGNDQINGGGGIDRIYGGDGNDIQRGQDGNDTLYGSAGNDQLNGGAGFDIANYSLAGAGVTVNMLTGGTGGDAAGDTYFGIEAVYGSDFADDITGNNSSNELRGGDGADRIDGGGGNDRIYGGAGGDMLFGGAGMDILIFTEAISGITVNLQLNTGGGSGDSSGDFYFDFEWVFGSDFGDVIQGDNGNNRLEGRDGNDTLNGEGGNDRLLGGDGNDDINGGDGVDTIFGQAGDDFMFGGNGNDFFFGGAGNDIHEGGDGIDTVSYLASSSGLVVNMSGAGIVSTGDAAGDLFGSIERIFGSGFDDMLLGNAENNTLIGNGGADYLSGGGGNDSLNGGAGIDSFGYDETVDGADVIQGFTLNETVFIYGGTVTDFATLRALGSDAGTNVIFDFGGGNTLTIVGRNLADLDAGNFDFSGMPPASEPLNDPDAFAADIVDIFDVDALI
ncbi:MAG: hypothetical protein ABJN69_13215 [Hellea sp.]